MKKTLLTITAALLSVSMASAQCTPLAAYADSTFGLWPDSAEFISSGAYVGQAYNTQIDIKTFVDTAFQGQNVKIDAFKILSVTGLPTGFSWTGGGTTWNGTNTWYNEGATSAGTANPSALAPVQGCLNLVADASAVTAAYTATSGPTDYPLVVNVDIRIGDAAISFLVGQWASALNAAVAVDKYILRVNPAVGIAEMLNSTRFDVGQNYPNPSTGETIITFNTPVASNVEFRVYNMLGMTVHTDVISAQSGLNEIKFNTRSLPEGIYMYTVNNGERAITKKMHVK
jgi:hypothetical protein